MVTAARKSPGEIIQEDIRSEAKRIQATRGVPSDADPKNVYRDFGMPDGGTMESGITVRGKPLVLPAGRESERLLETYRSLFPDGDVSPGKNSEGWTLNIGGLLIPVGVELASLLLRSSDGGISMGTLLALEALTQLVELGRSTIVKQRVSGEKGSTTGRIHHLLEKPPLDEGMLLADATEGTPWIVHVKKVVINVYGKPGSESCAFLFSRDGDMIDDYVMLADVEEMPKEIARGQYMMTIKRNDRVVWVIVPEMPEEIRSLKDIEFEMRKVEARRGHVRRKLPPGIPYVPPPVRKKKAG